MIEKFYKILKNLHHVAFVSFILVLPVGYYADNPDSTIAAIGIHGGSGQFASVLRGCDAEILDSERNKFRDISGSAYVTVNPKDKYKVVLGLRAGSWISNLDYRKAGEAYYDSIYYKDYSYSYFNPNISLEGRSVGLGFGLFMKPIPINLPSYGGTAELGYDVSGHLRIGTIEHGYFALSFAEGTPIMSGSGFFDIGFGYPIESIHLFSGLTGGWFDQAGFLQQVRVRVHKNIDLDFSVRIGESDSHFEYAISTGFAYRFNLHKKKIR